MSVVVRVAVAVVVVVALAATAGCDSVFRFDEPPAARSDGGASTEDGASADASLPPSPCTDDTTCGGLRCQVSTGTCVACLVDAQCSGSRPRCATGLGICVECSTTLDCPEPEHHTCNTETRRCVDTCSDTDDCSGPPFTCGSNKLCTECTSDPNCLTTPSRPFCEKAIGHCVECAGNAQCPPSRPICDRRTGKCESCVTSTECGAGSVCDPATLTCRQAL